MKIIGTGSAHPKKVVTNKMLAEMLDTSDEWIVSRSGIKERRVLSTETIEDLGTDACNDALMDANVKAEEIDYLICSNVVNEFITPGLGCVIQGNIGGHCPTIDVNCACAGFIYALQIADAFFKTNSEINKMLVVAAEAPGRMMSWKDRSTCVLFGDGAGAVVLTRDQGANHFKSFMTSTTSKYISLYQKRSMWPSPWTEIKEENTPVIMDGRDIFKLAVSHSMDDMDQVIEKAGISADDIDMYVLHQANIRIIEAVRKFLKQPKSKFPTNIEKYGNTSSASIPMLLDELNKTNKLKKGNILALSAFGAGFTTAACILEW
ncbi:MAG: ketoacyl-ACP synthase III [Bacteroidales bacterium]